MRQQLHLKLQESAGLYHSDGLIAGLVHHHNVEAVACKIVDDKQEAVQNRAVGQPGIARALHQAVRCLQLPICYVLHAVIRDRYVQIGWDEGFNHLQASAGSRTTMMIQLAGMFRSCGQLEFMALHSKRHV